MKLILGVLSTLIFIITVYTIFTQVSVRLISENTNQLTNGLSMDVNKDVNGFSEHYAGTLTFYETENVQQSIKTTINRAKSDLLTISSFNEIYTLNNGGISALFQKFAVQNNLYQHVYFKSPTQSLIIYPKKAATLSNKAEEWYKNAEKLKNGEFFISNPHYSQESKGYFVSISTPVYQNNRLFGVLGIDLSLNSLAKEISESKVGTSGYVILADKKGTLLAYKDSNEVLNQKNITDLPIFKEQKNGSFFLDINKVTYIMAKDQTTGWQIFSVIPQSEVKSFSETISKNMSSRIANADESASDIISKLLIVQVIVVIVLLGVSILISFLFARYFIDPVKKLAIFLKNVAAGDLTKKMKVKTKDEIGVLFKSVNDMVESLREMTKKMIHLVQEVEKDANVLNEQAVVTANVTETVASAMSEVSVGTEKLTADMVNISLNVENNNEFVLSMTENIDKIVEHARDTKSITSNGQSAMENMNSKIDRIVGQSIESTEIMKELNRKLQAINEITALIHEISDQTNLLSLNASIEAARAGEQGKGFAVVAQEVKKLAEQSSKSVEEISGLISEIQDDSKKALENINNGRQSAIEGANMTKATEKSFHNIFTFIDFLAGDIEKIAQASEKLSSSSKSITSSVDSVATVSEQTTAGVQEVASTTEEQRQAVKELESISKNLNNLTRELRKSTEHFKL
jgi:methyl-accepting chemotaxis protein